jgi:peptidoglycan glycosyltransferase
MRVFRNLSGLIDGKKLRMSVLLGLVLGVGLTVSFASNENRAGEKEYRAVAQSIVQVAAMLPGELMGSRTATTPDAAEVPPEAPVDEELFEPADFLDASMELLLEAGKGGPPTVALESGEELTFSIVPELQAEVEKLYRDYRPEEAGFVAIDPRTGEILALTGWVNGEIAPHRALKADGPAASIFKMVSAAALVEKHTVRIEKEFCYHGGRSSISKRLLNPDPERDRDCLSFAAAMGKSANVIFARLADSKLSRSDLKMYGERFGFNRVIPFVWPVELSKMDVPDDRLEFARMAAGFNHSRLSPLHGALMAGAVANGGLMMQPQILRQVVSADGATIFTSEPRAFQQVVSSQTAQKLTRMMVTTTTEGTARKYVSKAGPSLSEVVVAGKTGSLSQARDGERLYHSWLVGFAPADDPQVAFASLVVNGPKWRVKGPYVARKALEKYFQAVGSTGRRMAHK